MKIGVTGIYASGKGTVCSMFEDLGARVIDTDVIARQIVEPGSDGLSRLVEEFGKAILDSDGRLERRSFANIVFKDPLKVKRLNKITHPIILGRVFDIISGAPDEVYMVNTPLLFESGFDRHMDKNIVVVAHTGQVIGRGMNRDRITEKEIRERLNHQNSLNEKIKKADYVIDNSGTLENTKRQVRIIWNSLTRSIHGT